MKTGIICILGFLLLISATLNAQVGIGTTTPDSSAQLDVSSVTKGFLPPRMTYVDRNAILNPVAGLIIWCSNCASSGEVQVYNGTTWTNISGTTASFAFPVLAATTAATAITSGSATSGGNILSDGGAAITARGVCWSTTGNPTVLDTKTTDGTGTGSFSSSITGLAPNTSYNVRAYATNAIGSAYGAIISFTTHVFIAIGNNYQGGVVAYILQPGDPGYDAAVPHGFIAAASDQSSGIPWYNGSYPVTGATATALGTGNANTNTIVAVQGAGSYAAQLCRDLVLNSYSDWYLPSKNELNKIFINRVAIGGFAVAQNFYWSSSETNSYNAWLEDFYDGSFGSYFKDNPGYVRAIRSF